MANVYIRRPIYARDKRPQDWALVVLAIWLFISPWVLQFGGAVPQGAAGTAVVSVSHAAWNAWVIGAILFFVMLSALGRLDASQEWIALVLGAWTFAAPWALGFVALGRASWDHWIAGALVFLVAAWNIWELRNAPVTDRMPPPGQPLT